MVAQVGGGRQDGAGPEAQKNPNGVFGPERMELSEQERQWALSVRSAVNATAELDNLSDFMCAQLALIHRENTEAAIEKATILQEIRQAFDIKDTFESSLSTIKLFVTLHPGYLVTLINNEGTLVMTVDSSKKPTSRELRSLRGGVEKFLHGIYVLFHILNFDFEAIRRGKFY